MTVVFFPKGDRSVPSSRYRCYYFAEELERQGVPTRVIAPPLRAGLRPRRGLFKDLVRLNSELRATGPGDVVYLQRPIHSTPFVCLVALHQKLRRRRCRLVFDYCDPIFLHSPRKTRLLCRLADAVVVSCEDLATFARDHNERVHVIPNSVPDSAIAARPSTAHGDPPVLGWVGNARLHRNNLRLLFEALEKIGRPVILRIIGAAGAESIFENLKAVPHVSVDLVGWLEPEDVPRAVVQFDAALLPVEESPWNQKLLTKLIEYLALGVPVIASPVGENRLAIEDGANGFLASSPDQWAAAIARVVGSQDLRNRLASGALDTARHRYRLSDNVLRLADLIAGLRAS